MVKKKSISIRLNEDIVKQLKQLKRPGQSFNGVLQELLERLEKIVEEPK